METHSKAFPGEHLTTKDQPTVCHPATDTGLPDSHRCPQCKDGPFRRPGWQIACLKQIRGCWSLDAHLVTAAREQSPIDADQTSHGSSRLTSIAPLETLTEGAFVGVTKPLTEVTKLPPTSDET